MDKEIVKLILESDQINSDQKTELIKELIKNTLHIPHYPFNEPAPNWQEPHIVPGTTPCPNTSPFYYGTEITCRQEPINKEVFNNIETIAEWFNDVTKGYQHYKK